VVVSTDAANVVIAAAKRHAVPARLIGRVRAGERLTIRTAKSVVEASVAVLADAYHEAIPRRMSRSAASVEVAFTAATPA
jgi:hypothetical protein